MLQNARVDLLLADIESTQLNGFHIMEKARQHQPELVVVFMTETEKAETAVEAYHMGANGLIVKPFNNDDELVETVNRALTENEQKQEAARLQTLRSLIQLTQKIFAETNTDSLIDLILTTLKESLNSPHVGFYQREADGNTLDLVSGIGTLPSGEVRSFDGGLIGRTDAWGAPILKNWNDRDDPSTHRFLIEYNMGSVMCAPALRSPHMHVVLFAGRGVGDPPFTKTDFELFSILAHQAAIALENAQLYQELRETIQKVEESQQALIQAEKMAAIGRITASIAHEVNNPLQAISNCLHLAGREELQKDQRDHYFKLAQTELNRLMDIVQHMLDFYRPGNLSREPVNMNQILDHLLTLMTKQLRQQKIEVIRDFQPNLPNVTVVSNQIQQVLLNLLINAVESMPGGGKIFIRTKLNRNQVETIIKDTGPGIPKELQNRIFEPYVSTKEKGTGLGLAVSYNIVVAHGGTLEYLNRQTDWGASFRIAFPVKG